RPALPDPGRAVRHSCRRPGPTSSRAAGGLGGDGEASGRLRGDRVQRDRHDEGRHAAAAGCDAVGAAVSLPGWLEPLVGSVLPEKRVPYVPQMEITDCGAACLAMTLAYHGRRVPLDELRRVTGTGRDGVNAYSLAEAARRYGLSARGVRVDMHELEALPPASILHWNFDHFVVYEGISRGAVRVVDPGAGRQKVPNER